MFAGQTPGEDAICQRSDEGAVIRVNHAGLQVKLEAAPFVGVMNLRNKTGVSMVVTTPIKTSVENKP
jgi:hypothetical protein